MKDKLQLLINSEEKLTQSAFAEMLGIQPATISHILAGRNKPSYELLQKILLRFPNVSADWLMADRGEMLRDVSLTPFGIPRGGLQPEAAGVAQPAATSLYDAVPARPATSGTASQAQTGIQGTFFDAAFSTDDSRGPSVEPRPAVSAVHAANEDVAGLYAAVQSHTGVPVERVVVFYADKTFDTYIPKK